MTGGQGDQDEEEIAYRANERIGMLMDDRGREPTREEINRAWLEALEQVRGMGRHGDKEQG